MGLGLANAYGTEALSSAIKEIIAQRKSEEIARQADAYKRSQDAIKNGFEGRRVGVDEGNLGVAQDSLNKVAMPNSAANIAHTNAETAGLTQDQSFASDNRTRALGNLQLIPDAAPAPGRMSPRLIAGLKQFNGIDFATPSGERATVSPGNLGAEEGQAEASSFNNGGSNVYRQKLGFETAAKIAVENSKPKTASPAVAQSSYQYTNGELGKIAKPIQDRMDNVQQALQLVNASTPQADALVAPAILKAEVGGAGSGLRMTTAEINNVMGGRGKWESLKAAIQKWNPNSGQALAITPDQRADMQKLLSALNDRTQTQLSIIRDSGQRLSVSEDPSEHKKILSETQQKLDAALNSSQSSGVVKWGRDAQGRPVIVK